MTTCSGQYAEQPEHYSYALAEAQVNAQSAYEELAGPGDPPLEETLLVAALTIVFFNFVNPEDTTDRFDMRELAQVASNQWDNLGEEVSFASFTKGLEMLMCHYAAVRQTLINEGAMEGLSQADQFVLTRHRFLMLHPSEDDPPS